VLDDDFADGAELLLAHEFRRAADHWVSGWGVRNSDDRAGGFRGSEKVLGAFGVCCGRDIGEDVEAGRGEGFGDCGFRAGDEVDALVGREGRLGFEEPLPAVAGQDCDRGFAVERRGEAVEGGRVDQTDSEKPRGHVGDSNGFTGS